MGHPRGLIVVILTGLVFTEGGSGSISTKSTNTSENSRVTSGFLDSSTVSSVESTTDAYSASVKYYNSTAASPLTSESANATVSANISSTGAATETTNNTGSSVATTSLSSTDKITEISSTSATVHSRTNKSTTPAVLKPAERTLNHTTESTKEIENAKLLNVSGTTIAANSTSRKNDTNLSTIQANTTVHNSNSTTQFPPSAISTTETAHNLSGTELPIGTVLLPNRTTSISSSSLSSSSKNSSTTLPPSTNVSSLTTSISNSTSQSSPSFVITAETAHNSSNTELPTKTILLPNSTASNFSSPSVNSSTSLPSLTSVTNFIIPTTPSSNFSQGVTSSNKTTSELKTTNATTSSTTPKPVGTTIDKPSVTVKSTENVTHTPSTSSSLPTMANVFLTASNATGLTPRSITTINATENNATTESTNPIGNTTLHVASTSVVAGVASSAITTAPAVSMATHGSATNSTSIGTSTHSDSPLSTTVSSNATTVSPSLASTTESCKNDNSTVHSLTTAASNNTIGDNSTISASTLSSNSFPSSGNSTNATVSIPTNVSMASSSNSSHNNTSTTTSSPGKPNHANSTSSTVWNWIKSLVSNETKNGTVATKENSTSTMKQAKNGTVETTEKSIKPPENITIAVTMSSPVSTISNVSLTASSTTELTIHPTPKVAATTINDMSECLNAIGGANTVATNSISSSTNSTLNIENTTEYSTTVSPTEVGSNSTVINPSNSTSSSTNSTLNMGNATECSNTASTRELRSNSTVVIPDINDHLNTTVHPPTTTIAFNNLTINGTTVSTTSSSFASTSSRELKNRTAISSLNATDPPSSTSQPSNLTSETSHANSNMTTQLPSSTLSSTTNLSPSTKVYLSDVAHSVTSKMATNIKSGATNATHLGNSTTEASLTTIASTIATRNMTEKLISTTIPGDNVTNTVATLSPAPRTAKAFSIPEIDTISAIPSNATMKLNSTTKSPELGHQTVNETLPIPSTTMVPTNSTRKMITSTENVTSTTESSAVLTTKLKNNSSTAVFTNATDASQSIYNFTDSAVSSSSSSKAAIPSANATILPTSTVISNSSNITLTTESTTAIPAVMTLSNPTSSSKEILTNSLPMTTIKIPTFNYVVKDNTTEIPCMLLNMSMIMEISYNKTDQTIGTGTLVVPKNASSNGICSEKTSQVMLTWNSMKNRKRDLTSDGQNTVVLNFISDALKSSLDSIVFQIYLDPKAFPDASEPTLSGNTTTSLGLFSSTVNRGHYICNAVTDVDAGNVSVKIRNVSLIAFNKDNETYSKQEEDCVAATSINKAAVIGGAIGGILIVGTVAIYLCRKKTSSYDSSTLP